MLKLHQYTVTSFRAQNGPTDVRTLDATTAFIEALIKTGKKDAAEKLVRDTLQELERNKAADGQIKEWENKLRE